MRSLNLALNYKPDVWPFLRKRSRKMVKMELNVYRIAKTYVFSLKKLSTTH